MRDKMCEGDDSFRIFDIEKSHRENIDFIFLIRCNIIESVDNYVCCSTFIKDQKDYEKNQRRCTILKKQKH